MADKDLAEIYSTLKSRFGFLDWWPGETRDEIVIGAILTQNTSWKNVEKAILNLKSAGMLDLRKISNSELRKLEALIRPSGFYRQKARRLRAFSQYIYSRHGGTRKLFGKGARELREELLSINGIGPETADSIMLYAADKPVFVIDAYTRRAMSRIMGRRKEFEYHELQSFITERISKDLGLYKDFHAQFVELGKNYCRKEPLCENCPLVNICAYPNNK